MDRRKKHIQHQRLPHHHSHVGLNYGNTNKQKSNKQTIKQTIKQTNKQTKDKKYDTTKTLGLGTKKRHRGEE